MAINEKIQHEGTAREVAQKKDLLAHSVLCCLRCLRYCINHHVQRSQHRHGGYSKPMKSDDGRCWRFAVSLKNCSGPNGQQTGVIHCPVFFHGYHSRWTRRLGRVISNSGWPLGHSSLRMIPLDIPEANAGLLTAQSR
jgi:hypothetical protein